MAFRKIINDPVFGFITIDNELIYQVISHPYYQRLRRIHQMALAAMVYPGATHSRLHHSLGAYHLMCNALHELKSKGVAITAEEEEAAKIAILLHDIGHGPYSHALENILVKNYSHEQISLMLMQRMNLDLEGRLQMAIEIFTGAYPRKFLHQLISGQLDVDRMDYLIRDSFFTGVTEGVIGYDRILKMLTVHNDELMVEEKGIHSIEKFLVSRRFMYWQVYLHKTVLCAEKMLVKIVERAREIKAEAPSKAFNLFLQNEVTTKDSGPFLEQFVRLDDFDVMFSIKTWTDHPDIALSVLCKGIINRHLLKVKYAAQPIEEQLLAEKRTLVKNYLRIDEDQARYLAFTGVSEIKTYDNQSDHISILFKDGSVKDISEVDNPLINQTLFGTVKKFYICFINVELIG